MKISIITIVYNNVDTINHCLQSVAEQTYADVEHIVIDGNSTDGTRDKILKLKDTLGYFTSERDNGLYEALNKGIKRATGDIIGILHSDDFFYDCHTLKTIASAFSNSNADLIYAKGLYVDKETSKIVKRAYPSRSYRKYLLKFGWIPLHTTIFVRREIFDKYGLYNENYKIASDYEISLRWFKNDEINKYYLDAWLVKMRLGGKSTTASLQKIKSKEDLEIIKQYGLWGFFTLLCKIGRKIPQYLRKRY